MFDKIIMKINDSDLLEVIFSRFNVWLYDLSLKNQWNYHCLHPILTSICSAVTSNITSLYYSGKKISLSSWVKMPSCSEFFLSIETCFFREKNVLYFFGTSLPTHPPKKKKPEYLHFFWFSVANLNQLSQDTKK